MAPRENTYDSRSNRCRQQHFFDEDISASKSFQSCQSSLQSNETKKKKTVSFSTEEAVVRQVLNRLEYSRIEIVNTWYSSVEIRFWKSECKAMMKNMIPMDCERGLENKRTTGASRMKKQNKRIARNAVFREQASQKRAGICDPDAIADEYFDANEHCQVAAHMIAMRDELDAKMIYSERCGSVPVAGASSSSNKTKFDSFSSPFQAKLGCVFLPRFVTTPVAA